MDRCSLSDGENIMALYYMDGAFVPAEEAVLPVTDLIILRGYGVFDFLRTYGGVPFHLEAHVRRLLNSAKLIGISCPWDSQEIQLPGVKYPAHGDGR